LVRISGLLFAEISSDALYFCATPLPVPHYEKSITANLSRMKKEVKIKTKLMGALLGDIQNCMENVLICSFCFELAQVLNHFNLTN
jgi:hypothetical protein